MLQVSNKMKAYASFMIIHSDYEETVIKYRRITKFLYEIGMPK